ncbi:hypothetical protein CC80DRAFT_594308 [Byssothecium circinans]|uniref:Uncharacterized protein n=1 Tax=Byssothecium circinans TaxID=147558 RepID=A0A6A5U359_9PLEO|nr:hypothetical protein CC80DRAFT_594308 [Byssothecium circinans]
MSLANFTKLSQELQDQIWAEAAAIQYQQSVSPTCIADGQPESCTAPYAERQRQAFVGYDDLPDSTERQPLRLYIHASRHTDELRLGVNEFQTLVNRLPVATVCADARAQAVKLCRVRIQLMNLFRVVEDPMPDGKQILEPVFPFEQLKTVMVTTANHPEDGPEGFDSVDRLVDVISRVFGSCVEKIIWSTWWGSGSAMSDIYWPHTPQMGQLEIMDGRIIDQSGHGQPAHFMTPDHVLHIEPEVYKAEIDDSNKYYGRIYTWYDRRPIYWHCLKISELLGAASATSLLPRLQHIEVELHNSSWGKIYMVRLETTYKDGVIWVGRHNLHLGNFHRFFSSV